MEKKKISNNFITICVNAFNKFVAVFKKNGILTVTFIMVLFLIFYLIIINPININSIIEKKLYNDNKEREYVDDTAFERRLQADEYCMPLLDEIVENNHSIDRAMIFELHNGVKTKGHIDMLFMSCTFESIASDKPELDMISDMFQRQSINSMFASGIYPLRYKKYLYYNDLITSREGTSRLLRKLNRFGIKSVMIIPVLDSKNVPIILIILASSNDFNAKEAYNKLKPSLNNLKNILVY